MVTNHQAGPEAAVEDASRTLARCARLEALRAAPATTRAHLVAAFLAPPVLSRDFAGVMGTFYTAVYRPAAGAVDFPWPDRPGWAQSRDAVEEGARAIPG